MFMLSPAKSTSTFPGSTPETVTSTRKVWRKGIGLGVMDSSIRPPPGSVAGQALRCKSQPGSTLPLRSAFGSNSGDIRWPMTAVATRAAIIARLRAWDLTNFKTVSPNLALCLHSKN